MTIHLKDTFIPQIAKNFPLMDAKDVELQKFLKENLTKGYITPSTSEMAFAFFFIKKKDGKLRPVQDYRYLNEHTHHDTYPLPHINELTDKLRLANWFMKLDLHWGYNNILIAKQDRWKAAFCCKYGVFKPTVMFFGLTNSPACFQRFMMDMLQQPINKGWLIVYMDDILIFSEDLAEH